MNTASILLKKNAISAGTATTPAASTKWAKSTKNKRNGRWLNMTFQKIKAVADEFHYQADLDSNFQTAINSTSLTQKYFNKLYFVAAQREETWAM